MIKIFISSLAVVTGNYYLHQSSVSGLAVEVSVSGSKHWLALDFWGSTCRKWQHGDLPVGVVDFTGNLVRVEDFDSQTIEFEALKRDRNQPVRFSDMIGSLAFGPNSMFMRQRSATFSRTRSGVSLRSHTGKWGSRRTIALESGVGLWEFRGSLGHPRLPMKLRDKERIVFDFSQEDTILPLRLKKHFLSESSLFSVWGHLADNRLHVGDWIHRENGYYFDRETFKLEIKASNGGAIFQLPVFSTGEGIVQIRGSWLFPMSLRFADDSPVIIGASLLRRYQVTFDGMGKRIGIMRPDSSSPGAIQPHGKLPKRHLVKSFYLDFDGKKLKCLVKELGLPIPPPDYQIIRQDALGIEVAMLLEDTKLPRSPLKREGNGLTLFSALKYYPGDPSGSFSASVDPNGDYEFKVTKTGPRTFRIGLSLLPQRSAVPNVRSRECAICLEALNEREARVLELCGHAYHRGCIDQWASLSKRCPLCREGF